MISSGLSGKPTLCGLLALSTMEIVASQKPGLPLAILQQPTRNWHAIMANSEVAQEPRSAVASPTPAIETELTLAQAKAPDFSDSSAIATPATAPPSDSFRDLQSHWSQPFVELLAARDIVSGYDDGTFQPDRAIQADHFGMMLYRAKLYRIKVLQRELGIATAQQPPAIAPTQASAASARLMAAAAYPATEVEAEILLQTHNIRTRAQAAVFIYRNMQGQVIGQVPAVDSIDHTALQEPIPVVKAFDPDFAAPLEEDAPLLSEGFHWSESTLVAQS